MVPNILNNILSNLEKKLGGNTFRTQTTLYKHRRNAKRAVVAVAAAIALAAMVVAMVAVVAVLTAAAREECVRGRRRNCIALRLRVRSIRRVGRTE